MKNTAIGCISIFLTFRLEAPYSQDKKCNERKGEVDYGFLSYTSFSPFIIEQNILIITV